MMTNFIRPRPLGVEPSVAAGLLQDGQRQQRVRDRVQLQQRGEVDDSSQGLPIELNFSSDGPTNQDDTKSLIGADPSDSETFYNDQILRQLFLDFKVKSEEGRSVLHYICWPLLNIM